MYTMVLVLSFFLLYLLKIQPYVNTTYFWALSIIQIIFCSVIVLGLSSSVKSFLNFFWRSDHAISSLICFTLTLLLFTLMYSALLNVDLLVLFSSFDFKNFFYFFLIIGLSEEALFRVLPSIILKNVSKPILVTVMTFCFVFYHYDVNLHQIIYFSFFSILMFNLYYQSVPILGLALIHGWHNTLISATPSDLLLAYGNMYIYIMSLFIIFILCLNNWVSCTVKRMIVLKCL